LNSELGWGAVVDYFLLLIIPTLSKSLYKVQGYMYRVEEAPSTTQSSVSMSGGMRPQFYGAHTTTTLPSPSLQTRVRGVYPPFFHPPPPSLAPNASWRGAIFATATPLTPRSLQTRVGEDVFSFFLTKTGSNDSTIVLILFFSFFFSNEEGRVPGESGPKRRSPCRLGPFSSVFLLPTNFIIIKYRCY
jgi:hypothetical protein